MEYYNRSRWTSLRFPYTTSMLPSFFISFFPLFNPRSFFLSATRRFHYLSSRQYLEEARGVVGYIVDESPGTDGISRLSCWNFVTWTIVGLSLRAWELAIYPRDIRISIFVGFSFFRRWVLKCRSELKIVIALELVGTMKSTILVFV